MKRERKTFKVKIGDNEVELYFRNPNQEELLSLDLEYRKIFSQCLREGIMSEAEAKKIAEKNGVWTKSDDKKISDLAIEISLLESVVNNEDGKSNEKQIEDSVVKLSDRRAEFLATINSKVEVSANSAEGLANQQKMHRFVQLCCMDMNNNRLFSNISSYEKFIQDYPDTLSEIYKQAYFYEYGDPSQVYKEWAEVKYLTSKVEEANKKEELPKQEVIEEPKEEPKEETRKPGRKAKNLAK